MICKYSAMNINHHVSDVLLTRYAAGGLGEAWSLAVATHAALCPLCRDAIAGAESVGGALIDDISFKKHKQKVEDEKSIIFLNPSDTENGFYIETGWTSIGNKIKVPTKESEWTVKGNNILSENSPVILQWNNQEGVTFEKIIEFIVVNRRMNKSWVS